MIEKHNQKFLNWDIKRFEINGGNSMQKSVVNKSWLLIYFLLISMQSKSAMPKSYIELKRCLYIALGSLKCKVYISS